MEFKRVILAAALVGSGVVAEKCGLPDSAGRAIGAASSELSRNAAPSVFSFSETLRTWAESQRVSQPIPRPSPSPAPKN